MYGKRLYINWAGFNDNLYRFDIYERDYAGTASERDGCPSCCVIDWGDGANEDFATIVGSKATVQFYSDTQGEFSAFYAADKRQFYGELIFLYNSNEYRVWRGWIVPEQRNEQLDFEPVVALTFMDGLGELKNTDFLDASGNAYTGRLSYISIISTILAKLETGFNIYTSSSFRPSGTTGDAFANMYVDVSIYDGMNCAEVLEQLLKNARIMQTWKNSADSFWFIQDFGCMEIAGADTDLTGYTGYTTYIYDSTGAATGSETKDQVVYLVDDNNNYHLDAPQFTNWPAWDHLDFNSNFSKVETVLKDGDFEKGFTTAWIYATGSPTPVVIVTLPDGNNVAGIRYGAYYEHYDLYGYDRIALQQTYSNLKASSDGMKIAFKYNLIEGATGLGDTSDFVFYGMYITRDSDGQKLVARLVYDDLAEQLKVVFDVAWEEPTDSWRHRAISVNASYNTSNETHTYSATIPQKKTKAADMTDYEMVIESIPANCSLTICFWRYYYDENAKDPRGDFVLLIDDVKLSFIDSNLKEYPDSQSYRMTNNATFIELGDDFDIYQGNVIDNPNSANIFDSTITSTAATDSIVETFETDMSAAAYSYAELIGRQTMSNHRRPATSVDFKIATGQHSTKPELFVNDANSSDRFLAFVSFSYDFEESIVSGNMVQLLPFDETSSFAELASSSGSSSGSSSSGSSKSMTESHSPVTLDDNCTEEISLNVSQQILKFDSSLTHKRGRKYYTKGTYNVPFGKAFTAPYGVIAYGSTGSAAFMPIITDVSHLDYFTMKTTVDGYVTWFADVITETT